MGSSWVLWRFSGSSLPDEVIGEARIIRGNTRSMFNERLRKVHAVQTHLFISVLKSETPERVLHPWTDLAQG